MAEGDAAVEDEAFAAPLAVRLGYLLQVFQDAAFEVVDLIEAEVL